MIDVDERPEAADEDETVVEPAPDPLTRRRLVTVAALALVALGLLALGVVLWLQVDANAERDADRAAVLSLAGSQSVALTSVNPDNVKEQTERLLANSTGEFRRQFDAASPTFAKVVSEGEVHSEGRVAEAGVVSLTGDKATVLVALNSTLRNTETDKDEPRNYRLRVDLEMEADRWLVSNMQFVA